MAIDLSGLGGALGAAAGGYLAGRNKGEAEAYRRQLLEADRAQKKAALEAQAEARRQSLAMQQEGLDLRREGLGLQREGLALRGKPRPVDTEQKTRDLVGQIWMKNLEKRRDLANQGFFNDPRNEPIARQYDMANEHAEGIASGRIPLTDLNWQLLSFATGVPAPSNSISGAVPDQPFQVDLGGGRQVSPPDFGPIEPGVGLGGSFIPSAPGEAPRRFVTEQQRQADERLGLQGRGVGVRERTLDLNAPYLRSRGVIAGADAATRPAMNQARLKDLGAGTALKGAQTRQITTLLPEKKKQTVATTKKTEVETGLAPRRVASQEAGQKETARHNRETEKQGQQRIDDTRAYRKQLTDRANKALAKKADSEKAAMLQKRVGTNLRIITGMKRDAAGKDVTIFTDPRVKKAQAQMETDLETLERLEKAEPEKRAPALAAPKADGGKTKMFGGQAYTWERFLKEGKQHGKKDADLKTHWAGLK